MTNNFMEAMNFRHACKVFENKKIPTNEFEQILEVARLSPSSFGMEHWKFLVIRDEILREKLQPLCWNQKQITTCSELVIIIAKTKDLVSDDYLSFMFKRKGLDENTTNAYIEKYRGFLEGEKNIYSWSSKQCYIALANMMTYSATIGIDSCAIEGFEKEKVEKLLDIDTTKEEVSVLVTFGYRKNEQQSKKRLDMKEIVEYI